MSYNDRIQSLLSAIDKIIEERGNVHRIEREIHCGEESRIVCIFAVNPTQPLDAGLMGEIDKTAILARDESRKLDFTASRIRTAKDRRGCRQFDIE